MYYYHETMIMKVDLEVATAMLSPMAGYYYSCCVNLSEEKIVRKVLIWL